jgi:cyclin-dependent kinase 7
LLQKCLIYEPRKRIDAKTALSHSYFTSMPYPTHPSKLPKPTNHNSSGALEEVDANVNSEGRPGPANKLKRKLTSPADGKARLISRKLDFSKQAPGS